MSKIEEVARAMCEDDGANWDAVDFNETANGDDPEDQREYWRQKALAAIRALREPDEGMTGAGAHHLTGHVAATCCHRTGGRGGLGTAPHCECREVFVDIWHAAFDSILSEAGEKP